MEIKIIVLISDDQQLQQPIVQPDHLLALLRPITSILAQPAGHLWPWPSCHSSGSAATALFSGGGWISLRLCADPPAIPPTNPALSSAPISLSEVSTKEPAPEEGAAKRCMALALSDASAKSNSKAAERANRRRRLIRIRENPAERDRLEESILVVIRVIREERDQSEKEGME